MALPLSPSTSTSFATANSNPTSTPYPFPHSPPYPYYLPPHRRIPPHCPAQQQPSITTTFPSSSAQRTNNCIASYMAGEIDKNKSKDGDGGDGNDGNNTNGSRRKETRSVHELATAQRAAAVLGSWEMLAMYAGGAGVGGMADGGESIPETRLRFQKLLLGIPDTDPDTDRDPDLDLDPDTMDLDPEFGHDKGKKKEKGAKGKGQGKAKGKGKKGEQEERVVGRGEEIPGIEIGELVIRYR